MNSRTTAILVLIPFTALTAMAIVSDGTNGFPAAITYSLTSLQIWVDLVIAMLFWCAWVIRDAKASGRNGLPWVIAALLFGAFAPLLYMVAYQRGFASPGEAPTAGDASRRRLTATIVIFAFAALTIAALWVDGTDIPGAVMRTWSNVQIWVDLVIIIVMWLAWLIKDARQHGNNPWGWVVFALVLGAFSPLLYTAVHGRWPASHPASS